MCPAALGQELARLPGSVATCTLPHIKPDDMGAVMTQIGAHGTPYRIHALAAGQVMRIE